MPSNTALEYAVCWCGHDAWGETRLLARRFAELMNYRGGYCIVRHMPDISVYYARTYGLLTELQRIAPDMQCLAMETSLLSRDTTKSIVHRWLAQYGSDISGIVSANDNEVLHGINAAIHDAGRDDIIRVSNGTTRAGYRLIREGGVQALTFKSPELDGAVPIQLASDWFNGLTIDPLRFLPVYIVTRENVEQVMKRQDVFEQIAWEPLERAIDNHDMGQIDSFFDSIVLRFVYMKFVSIDHFRGFTIELLGYLIGIIHRHKLNADTILGLYEDVFKHVFQHSTVEHTIVSMKQVAYRIVDELRNRQQLSRIDQVIQHVSTHYSEPLSLKELSNQFHLSARYLGRQFAVKTGYGFNEYLHSIRVAKAIEYLRNSALSASHISSEVGYSDPNYFYKIFHKRMGMSTVEFRKNLTE